MATFTNYATLSYTGGMTNSNTVTGELLEVLSASKVAVSDEYTAKCSVTYVISIINSGATAFTSLSVSDDLGAYTLGTDTLYPLEYTAGSMRYYVNGVLQAAPTVTAGPPLVISNLNVPANGNAILIYEAKVTSYAPLGAEANITNTATISGVGIATALTVSETVGMQNRAELSVGKSVSPSSVTENGQLTYTFVIQNFGAVATTASDEVVLSDNFDPILNPISVTFDGTAWTSPTNYTYNSVTGAFATVAGQISVPAATYSQNADGTWTVTPGTATLTVAGTV